MAIVLHDRLQSRVHITGRLVARTALHLGSGRPGEATDAAVLRDAAGRPLIPGSSLKGALRAAVDRLLPESAAEGLPWSCRLQEDHPGCLTRHPRLQQSFNERLTEELHTGRAESSAPPWLGWLQDHVCDVCAAFGSTAVAGRIRVLDLPVTGLWTEGVEIRDGVGIDRDSRTAAPGIKFDLEVVPAGSAFTLEIVAENLDDRARFVLAAALAELRDGAVRLGGRTTRGLGAVAVRTLQVRTLQLAGTDARARLRAYLIQREGALTAVDPDTWIDQALAVELGAGEEA